MREKTVYGIFRVKMFEANLDAPTLALKSCIPYRTLRSRLRGDSSFTVDEAIQLHKFVGQDVPIDKLFERNDAS